MRILVVEDHAELAKLYSAWLMRNGHEVRTVYDGRDAVDQAADFQPDAVISDIGLPELNGYEVAMELRKQEQFKSTLLIALTAYGNPLDVETAKAAGLDHHLTKPCDFQELKALLSSREPA